MAKESMKAREIKRAKTVAKFAEKRKSLKESGDYLVLQSYLEMLLQLECIIDVKSPEDQRVIFVNSVYQGLYFVKWQIKV